MVEENPQPGYRDCASCGEAIDTVDETHYQIGEEERPILEPEEMEFEDWVSETWLVCQSCIQDVIEVQSS